MSTDFEVRSKCERPRLRKINGQWYAFGRNTKRGRLLLVTAISWCNRLNQGKPC